jgi:hypothetical protein
MTASTVVFQELSYLGYEKVFAWVPFKEPLKISIELPSQRYRKNDGLC